MKDDVLFDLRWSVGSVTLNRPAVLNALSLEMIRALAAQLDRWAAEPGVAAVVIRGAGGRAFCAGGDIRGIWEAARGGNRDLTAAFFREEYALNLAVSRFPKPYVALWDGITMGGGVGLSIYGSHRVATERTLFAMPETAIGFFCDVGASWFLPRLPGKLGLYLALTGARLGAADLLASGAATHFVPSEKLTALEEALAGADLVRDGRAAVDRVLEQFSEPTAPAPVNAHRDAIDRCFGADSVEGILARLEAEGGDWARDAVRTLRAMSPTSLKVVHRALRRGERLTLEEALAAEYGLSQRFLTCHDFVEGIRAVLVERVGSPNWRPERLEDVTDDDVEEFFAPAETSAVTKVSRAAAS